MLIDIDSLREDLEEDSYAGAFAGIPAMLVEAWDAQDASDEEIIQMARDRGFDLSDYEDLDFEDLDDDYDDEDY